MKERLIKIIELVIETGIAFWVTVFFSEKVHYEGVQSFLFWQRIMFYFAVFAITILIEKVMSWVIKREINRTAERMGNLFGLADPRIGKAVSIVIRIVLVSMFTYVGFKKFI